RIACVLAGIDGARISTPDGRRHTTLSERSREGKRGGDVLERSHRAVFSERGGSEGLGRERALLPALVPLEVRRPRGGGAPQRRPAAPPRRPGADRLRHT
ncbi:MAG: hypothetical protein SGPRY_001151, partial [Prymnesium sp.]